MESPGLTQRNTGKRLPSRPSTNGNPKIDELKIQHDLFINQHFTTFRQQCRARILPWVQGETPYLVRFQRRVRHYRTIDLYFILTSLLGNHNFFLVGLPMLFWMGWTYFARSLVVLVLGVTFLSGWVKDWLCLPRPPAPPVVRLTWNEAHGFEYGFPSTHTCYSVSVGLFLLTWSEQLAVDWQWGARVLIAMLVLSICVGRLYCGMHSLTDVTGGLVMGVAWWSVFHSGWPVVDQYITSGDISVPFTLIALILVSLQTFPYAGGPCPCYQDCFASIGVIFGILLGTWFFSGSRYALDDPYPATIPFSYDQTGLFLTAVRILLGLVILVLWKVLAQKLVDQFVIPQTTGHPKQEPSNEEVETIAAESPRKSSDTLQSVVAATSCNGTTSQPPKVIFVPQGTIKDITSQRNLCRIVIYAGIGFLACYGVPILFEWLGLAFSPTHLKYWVNQEV
ncbi:Long-chain base-1-phosphate phosphatase [Dispira parvispora]|uniref:Long-chain base-1-phosphate phosphatase n=1 Tax=Dispira parvispora TaxID=1520584 RepID=A0A9W8AUP3_9FUNG|nr:Long-chain base-1-phosphate phosphatase [Dispira parvispora]